MRYTDRADRATATHVEDRDLMDGTTLRVWRCTRCDQSFEYVYRPYDRCPTCGTRLVALGREAR